MLLNYRCCCHWNNCLYDCVQSSSERNNVIIMYLTSFIAFNKTHDKRTFIFDIYHSHFRLTALPSENIKNMKRFTHVLYTNYSFSHAFHWITVCITESDENIIKIYHVFEMIRRQIHLSFLFILMRFLLFILSSFQIINVFN